MIDDVLQESDGKAEAVDDAAAERGSWEWWDFAIDQTLRLADLERGQRVLDVGCGPGELTARAAKMVAPHGVAFGVDRNTSLVEIARQRAAQRSLDNMKPVRGEYAFLPWRPHEFDVVMSAFTIFYTDDVAAVLARMWDLVRPGGRLVITALGPRFFSPIFSRYIEALAAEGVDVGPPAPWQRMEDPSDVADLLADAGVPEVKVTNEVRQIPLANGLADWARIVQSTGVRRLRAELSDEAAARVDEQVADWVAEHQASGLELEVVYAAAEKPQLDTGADAGVQTLADQAAGEATT